MNKYSTTKNKTQERDELLIKTARKLLNNPKYKSEFSVWASMSKYGSYLWGEKNHPDEEIAKSYNLEPERIRQIFKLKGGGN